MRLTPPGLKRKPTLYWILCGVIILWLTGTIVETRMAGDHSPPPVQNAPGQQSPATVPAAAPNPPPPTIPFSQMSKAQHLAEAKRFIRPDSTISELQMARKHLDVAGKNDRNNKDILVLYDQAIARLKAIANDMDRQTEQQAKAHPQGDLALVKCHEAVTSNLKAPSTAKFPSAIDDQIRDLGKWKYLIGSYVDAQNSFGAQMRTQYTCEVQCAAVDSCLVTSLHMIE